MEFGEKIAVLRKEHGMTQAELGSELNVTFQAVSKWERGESFPDFATMSKIAKLFGVPLTYFEDEEGESEEPDDSRRAEEDAPRAEGEEPEEPENKKMIGVCTECGLAVYEGQEGHTSPTLVCKTCCAREREKALQKKREEEQKKADDKKRAESAKRAEKATLRSKRNKGLLIGGIIAGVLLIVCFATLASSDSVSDTLIGGIFVSVFTFTFVSQLVWGGVVRTVCTTGGALIGTPGVIFTLDLDGMIFLVGVKILFAVLKLFIFLITSLFLVLVAYIISPFTFIPSIVKQQAQL